MLRWPKEGLFTEEEKTVWHNERSNYCLDFHGDPNEAKLVVLSDGNHHMALEEALKLFVKTYPEIEHIFYATTPPAPIVKLLKFGKLRMGNFILSVKPHLFISPPDVLDKLVEEGFLQGHKPFFQNSGNVLLIKKENPKKIFGITDLLKDNIRIFFSNPQTERASYLAYYDTFKRLAEKEGYDVSFLQEESDSKILYGKNIHHREAPQAVADGAADVAIVYYHLALRYIRIFPDTFDFIPLGGTKDEPEPLTGNIISQSNIGLIDKSSLWATELFNFLLSQEVSAIYSHHGLSVTTL